MQTKLGKKSYYVSDGVSTNDVNAATEFMYENEGDKNVIIKYIMQSPLLPIDISTELRYDYFVMKNVSDYLINSFDAYIA